MAVLHIPYLHLTTTSVDPLKQSIKLARYHKLKHTLNGSKYIFNKRKVKTVRSQ